jgi:hypothetical protein
MLSARTGRGPAGGTVRNEAKAEVRGATKTDVFETAAGCRRRGKAMAIATSKPRKTIQIIRIKGLKFDLDTGNKRHPGC